MSGLSRPSQERPSPLPTIFDHEGLAAALAIGPGVPDVLRRAAEATLLSDGYGAFGSELPLSVLPFDLLFRTFPAKSINRTIDDLQHGWLVKPAMLSANLRRSRHEHRYPAPHDNQWRGY